MYSRQTDDQRSKSNLFLYVELARLASIASALLERHLHCCSDPLPLVLANWPRRRTCMAAVGSLAPLVTLTRSAPPGVD
jgi:hypothetical protein